MVSFQSLGTRQGYTATLIETHCLYVDMISSKLVIMTREDTQKDDPTPVVSQRLRRESQPPSRPRWVNWFGIALVVLVVVFLAVHFAGLMPMHG
jgi:hypothetical protein